MKVVTSSLYCVQSKMDYRKRQRTGTTFHVLVVDWIETYQIVSLQSFFRNGQGLSALNDWSDLHHKTSVSFLHRVMTFLLKTIRSWSKVQDFRTGQKLLKCCWTS